MSSFWTVSATCWLHSHCAGFGHSCDNIWGVDEHSSWCLQKVSHYTCAKHWSCYILNVSFFHFLYDFGALFSFEFFSLALSSSNTFLFCTIQIHCWFLRCHEKKLHAVMGCILGSLWLIFPLELVLSSNLKLDFVAFACKHGFYSQIYDCTHFYVNNCKLKSIFVTIKPNTLLRNFGLRELSLTLHLQYLIMLFFILVGILVFTVLV